MKKRFSVIFILLTFMFTISFLSGYSNAKVYADSLLVKNSKSAYLMEANTNAVIYTNNEKERLPIASMCKVMTLLLCFDALEKGEIAIDEEITISENSSSMGGSQVFLETGGKYIVGDLIKSITVASANDACVAMAERICGSEESFVEKMNEKARELNMENTIFNNCTGLPKPSQYSCAKDVAIMFSELIKHEEYFRFSKIWTDVIKHPNDRVTEISNTNKLIRFYNGCDAGKTGYTNEAGHCLVASALRSGMRLISVVIKAPDSKTRFKEVSEMFNYGFDNFTNKVIIDNTKPLNIDVNVLGGKKDKLEVVAEKPVYVLLKKGDKRSFEINFSPIETVKAPVLKGDKVGVLSVYDNNEVISKVNVVSNENVNEKTFFDVLIDIGRYWSIF